MTITAKIAKNFEMGLKIFGISGKITAKYQFYIIIVYMYQFHFDEKVHPT